MTCSACLRDVRIIARGLCRACYQRWQKRGTTDYAPPRHRTFCQIDDCGKPVVSNGMCDMHRNRLRKHGSVEQTRPDSWGAKTKHPLYNSWAYLLRHRAQHPMADSWTDFLQFVADIGERPSPKHSLYSANDTLPIGPDNYVWKEAVTQKAEGEDDRTYFNRAQKVYRSVRKEAFKGYELKKRFGMDMEQYAALLKDQGGVCAICHQPETLVLCGSVASLAVDHCHAGGQVRGLLCRSCNTALGMFRDDTTTMKRAIAYLEKHSLPALAD